MSTFTCITCRVAFADMDLQREHYKTDWHRYNLKRKVADLPPVTVDNYNERVLAQKAKVTNDPGGQSGYCKICRKGFNSTNSYQNHLSSKKHKENEAKIEASDSTETKADADIEKGLKDETVTEKDQASGSKSKVSKKSIVTADDEEMNSDDDDDAESWDDDDALGLEECLFCDNIAKSFHSNMKHMTSAHSFFVPDIEYLTDMESLIGYLGEKVGIGKMCLWCNDKGKSFHTTKAVKSHMVDKGHCKLLHEGDALLEYTDFYDYRSSYPDYNPENEDAEMKNEEKEEEEDGVEQETLEEENYALVLPSGSTIGHRSLMRYYKQKFTTRKRPAKSSVEAVLAHYRALGWTGTPGAASAQRAKDLGYIQRLKQRKHMSLGVKANKLQHHFRQQVMF